MAVGDVVRAQLTVHVVVWDVLKTADRETAKLERELEQFGVRKLTVAGSIGTEDSQVRYRKIQKRLAEAGINENGAVLVTEDARLATYVYRKKRQGGCRMGAVFYEREGGGEGFQADIAVQGFEEIGVQFLDRIHKRANRLPWNILYTERTCVREIELSDLDEMYALYGGEGITEYTEPLFARQEEEEYVRSYIDYMYFFYGYGMWVVRDRATGKLLGRAGIERRDGEGEVLLELGYIIGREYQNQGYATEVCRAILAYARQELEIEELHCFIHPGNRASVRVAQKLGFALCGVPWKGQEGMLHYCRKI